MRCTSEEFTDWKRYQLIEPHGPPVTSIQLALCASAILNALTDGETTPEDFLIEPFEYAHKQAVMEGDLDSDDDEEIPTETDYKGPGPRIQDFDS